MRHALAAVLVLLALAPACSEPGAGDGGGDADGGTIDTRPRGVRCDEMQACGREHCSEELDAVVECNGETNPAPTCGEVPARWMPLQEAFAECLIMNGCNTTSCDLVGAYTREDGDIEEYCTVDGDGELANVARAAVGGEPDRIAECQALE